MCALCNTEDGSTGQFWEETFDAIPSAVTIQDRAFKVLHVNKAYCTIFGKKPDELIGRPCYEILHGTCGPIAGCPWKQTMDTKTSFTVEIFEAVLAIFVRITTSPLFDKAGKVTGCVHIFDNISERKNTEKALRESEQNFRSYIENAPDAVFIVDTAGKYMDCNSAASRMTGYCREDLLRMSIHDIAAEESLETVTAHLKKTIVNGVATSDIWHKHRDGSKYCLAVDAKLLSNNRILGFCKDITTRVRLENELKTARADFQNIVQKNADGIIIVNGDGIVRYINRVAEVLFGRTAGELVGELFGFPLVTDELIEIDIYRKGTRGGIGEMRKTETNWEGEKAYLVSIRDVTDRKKNEKRILIQNTTLQAINNILMEALSNSTENETAEKYLTIIMRLLSSRMGFVAEPDPDGRLVIMALSGGAATDTGIRKIDSALSGKRLADYPLLETIFRKGNSGFINDPAACPEWREFFGDNETVENFLGVPYENGDTTVGIVVLANKPGGYENADEEDVKTTTYVYQAAMLQKRAETVLNDTLNKLAISNKELEQFAYVASHDLQEPLRVVASYLQLIRERYAEKLDEKGIDFIARAFNGSKRMQMKIDDLLSYSRISTRAEPFSLCSGEAILESTLQNLETAINKSGTVVTHDPLPEIHAGEGQMVSLFQNLIGNAMKYGNCDGKTTVAISAKRNADTWLFSVKDNGIGIASEFYERIFEVFQRLHARDTYTGNGIGLSICKKIVERHKGKIWVESEVGIGSTFYFSIPAK